MASRVLNRGRMRRITLSSRKSLTDTDRDFVADLVSEEARGTPRRYSFVLHDIIESNRYCKLYVEASETALKNLLEVIQSNVPYKVAVASLDNQKRAKRIR